MFKDVLCAIEAHQTIIIHRHTRPDGDAIGSQTGLKLLLAHNYPDKKIYVVGDAPGRYGFIEGSAPDIISADAYPAALAIILDCGGAGLISDDRYTLAAQTVRLDHHIFGGKVADIEVIRPEYESCCGIVTALAMQAGFELTKPAAKALFTGMVTDSGRFRFDTTSVDTFERAAYLLGAGFSTDDVYLPLYEDELSKMQLRAWFVGRIKLTKHNVAYIYTDKATMATLDADDFTISRGMANVMSDIRGVSVWANFTETAAGVLCELRSNRHNICPIAIKFGGGGHAKACGCTLPDKAAAMELLAELDDFCRSAEEQNG